jgi:DNA-binding NtrC family response regulator
VADLRVPVLLRGEEGTGRDHAVRAILAAQGVDPRLLTVVRPGDAAPAGRRAAAGLFYLDGVEGLAPDEQAHWADRIAAFERAVDGAPRRVFASTSADLETLAHDGRFDAPLARTLGRFAIDLPPLRERIEDVGPLAHDLARRAAQRMGRPRVVFTAPAIRLLQRQSWPGNIAELEGIVEKLVAFSPQGQVTRRHVTSMLRESPASVRSLRRAAERRQREELLELLDATGGNLAEVARRLEVSRGAVIYRAQKFGLMPKPS